MKREGRKQTSLADVVRFAVSIRQGAPMPPDLVDACREVVEAAEGAPYRGFAGVPFRFMTTCRCCS